jgi:threonine synthase
MRIAAVRKSSRKTQVPQPLIERFRTVLPVGDDTPAVSLGEGSTPLLAAPRLSERYGCEIWLKWEGANPTGSYKDRGMTVAVSKAVESGAEAVICASTGNTAASAAAYAARAGIRAVVLVPQGAVAGPKLAQARILGARVLEAKGSFDDALAAAGALAERGRFALVNSLNPHRREGQKTAVYEIVEELGTAPDAFAIPFGGGGNTSAYAQALGELGVDALLVAAQAADREHTLASAIRIGRPAHADAVAASGATVATVDDVQIVAAWRLLAVEEGVFCEPSSAAGLAAIAAEPPRGARIVLTLTGHGLKDTDSVAAHTAPPLPVEPDPDAIAAAIGAEID